MKQDPQTKLAAARTRLILEKPFLGALVLRLPLRPAAPDWCPTTGTDARAIYYNPAYIESLSLAETQFVLAHEALHCALSHFARRQHRVRHRWDLACDYAINPLLIEDGLQPPPNALHMPLYQGMTAEEIYPLLDEQEEQETLDSHVYDPEPQQGTHSTADAAQRQLPESQDTEAEQQQGQGTAESPSEQTGAQKPPPLSPEEREQLSVQWRQRLAGAAQQALQHGKLSRTWARRLEHWLQPQLPWRSLLARYLIAAARDDYSYGRPSRRTGDFILPSLRSHQLEVVVALDTSGSITDGEMDAFIQEIDALKGQVRARLILLPCDAALCPGAPWIFEPWEHFQRPRSLQGGGGTSFRPVFDWVEAQGMQPDLLLYFTDAQGDFPDREPDYPVVWLVKGRAEVPWGARIPLN